MIKMTSSEKNHINKVSEITEFFCGGNESILMKREMGELR